MVFAGLAGPEADFEARVVRRKSGLGGQSFKVLIQAGGCIIDVVVG
jgi:hypothetical protein